MDKLNGTMWVPIISIVAMVLALGIGNALALYFGWHKRS